MCGILISWQLLEITSAPQRHGKEVVELRALLIKLPFLTYGEVEVSLLHLFVTNSTIASLGILRHRILLP